ncbi:MAG TPA: L,D-transpeptidase [Sulfurovum sp.]|nr:L,D-transpeptidase [Sulfurovum sp.]HQT29049.1 L,D-transpeptidase [Sulfurovum sp.]
MKKYAFLKTSLCLMPLYFSTAVMANIQDDRKQLADAKMQLYIVQKQNILLKDKLAKEKKKSFNITSIRAHEKLLKEYQQKEVRLYEEYNRVMQEQARKDAKMKALENQIPSLHGDIYVHVDLSDQIMNIYKGDTLVYSWFVSTATEGLVTPTGKYRPYHTEKMHFSKQFDNSPMPWSVFFKDGFAIHGTEYVRSLGYKASHGCVRLHPENAHKLYGLVHQHGYDGVKIHITD